MVSRDVIADMNRSLTSMTESLSGRAANTTRSGEIAKVLLDEILRGQFRVGERLPSERDLAARFQSGRGAVREALLQIEQLRLIEINPGGARIKNVRDSSIAVLGPLLALDKRPDAILVDQFLETFSVLTQLSGRRAIVVMNNDQRVALAERLEAMIADFTTGESGYAELRAFLESLGEISNNIVVRLIGNDLRTQLFEQMVFKESETVVDKESHLRLLKGIKASIDKRDGDLLSISLEAYFQEVRARIFQILDSQPVDESEIL